jgi:hypothetical protein
MQVGIMVTNGGPHSADKWAVTTAGQILQSVFSVDAADTVGARKFEMACLDILLPHHEKVQTGERGKLAKDGMKRLATPIDPREYCDVAVQEIAAAAQKIGKIKVPDPDMSGETKEVDLGEHFANPEVQQKLAGLIGAHFATAMDIERSWHADKNADDQEAKAYSAARAAHGGGNVHAHIQNYRK